MTPTHKDILRRTIEALEASLRRYPDNEKILHQLALAYSQAGYFDPRAVEVYQAAASRFPNDVKVQRALSIGFLVSQSGQLVQDITSLDQIDLGNLSRSVERLLQISREFPDSPYVHRALGDMQLIRGEDKNAIQHYRVAMALGITDLESVCFFAEQVRGLRRLSAPVVIFIAELHQRIGRPDLAAQVFHDFVEHSPSDPKVLDKYALFLQRQISEGGARDAEVRHGWFRQLARIGLMKGNLQEAMTWARQISVESMARDPRLAKDLARRLIAADDFRQAFDYLSHIPLDEESKSILNEMTVMLEKRGELDTAVYILQFINENDEISQGSKRLLIKDRQPDELLIEIETELQMAELHWKNRRWEQAFERYLRVLELGYDDYRSLLEPLDLLIPRLKEVNIRDLIFLTNFFAERRDWRRCRYYAGRGLYEQPTNSELSQRYLQACERILLENPNDHDVRLGYGDEHLRLGNIERALQEYRKAAESAEHRMKANRRLALASFRAGDLLGAFERYRELPVLEVEDLERLYDLGIAFGNGEQFREAFESIKLIREYDPAFRDVATRMAEYERRMNENAVGFVIDPKMRELIGDHCIGRYKYICKIGSGGMGVVHKVMDLKTNDVVAMKILREGLSSSGKAIDRFFREARIAATLHHKNIVNILDYNISNNYGQSYIAMEFVDGPSFRELIERKFAETVDISMEDILQVLDWTSQLCDALDATHKKGIIHRDIKPDNVMLAPRDLVKITDFGIVHIEEATFTPTGALVGTPRYMSPEQVHGGRIDARSDLYSVGIIIYELLIGSPPFISGDISYQQVNVLPTPPREICPMIPPVVDRLIMKCLEKSPADRFQSALELKRDIDEAYIRLGGDPERRRPRANDTGERTTPEPNRQKASSYQQPVLPVAPPPVRLPAGLSPQPEDETQESNNQQRGPQETRALDVADMPQFQGASGHVSNELDSDMDLS